MIAKSAWIIPKNCAQEAFSWNKKFQISIQIWCYLQEVISFVESLPEKLITLNWVTLEEHHLFEVADASVSHFS